MNAEPRDLIRAAFEMARKSGKLNWNRMTTAVLKNRLLVITQGKFREADYGVHNIIEFAEQAADILKIDRTEFQPVIELVDAQGVPDVPATYAVAYQRIRPDLWRAMVDYSSGNKYVWDREKGIARPQTAEDGVDALLPTMTPDDEAKWRREFGPSVRDALDEAAKRKLDAWIERAISPKFLPASVLPRWNEFFQHKLVERLATWFREKGIEPPEKFSVSVSRTPRITSEHDIEEIRNLVIGCVKLMTQDELTAMRLPPLAVLRARKAAKD